ncbi:hypothetical protein BH20ACI3_BH20ACI3_35090 [soil metagenome]
MSEKSDSNVIGKVFVVFENNSVKSGLSTASNQLLTLLLLWQRNC